MKMITANRLTDGRVIFWGEGGRWTSDIGAGVALDDARAEAELAIAMEDEGTEVVAPYLIEVEGDQPSGQKHLRESIRVVGPTTGSTKYRHGVRPAAEA